MALTPQTQQSFLGAILFQPPFRKRKGKWCDMAHSVVFMQAWMRWVLCNDIIPKAVLPFSMTCSMSSFGRTCQHHQTDRAHKNTPAMIHARLSLKNEGWVDGLALTTVDETPHHIHFHTIQPSTNTFLSLFKPSQNTL